MGSQVPERCHWRFARGQRGLLGRLVRRHQLVRHPRQACDHHAKGYSARQKNPWRTSLNPVSTVHCIPRSRSTRTTAVSLHKTSIFFRPLLHLKNLQLGLSDESSICIRLRPLSALWTYRRTEHHSSFRFFDPTFVFETVT